jgi:probable HAF family extracellular repeat protein
MPVYTYTTIDDPLAIGGTGGTQAFGINDFGQIVGEYTGGGAVHGFLYSGGTYVTLDDPLATGLTAAFDINNLGQIVGSYFNNTGTHGFLLTGGTYITLDVVGATSTQATGINDNGQIVGYYTAACIITGFSTATVLTPPSMCPRPSPP